MCIVCDIVEGRIWGCSRPSDKKTATCVLAPLTCTPFTKAYKKILQCYSNNRPCNAVNIETEYHFQGLNKNLKLNYEDLSDFNLYFFNIKFFI